MGETDFFKHGLNKFMLLKLKCSIFGFYDFTSTGMGLANSPSNKNDFLYQAKSLSTDKNHNTESEYSGTSKKGTLWDQYKFKCFVPFIEVVLF